MAKKKKNRSKKVTAQAAADSESPQPQTQPPSADLGLTPKPDTAAPEQGQPQQKTKTEKQVTDTFTQASSAASSSSSSSQPAPSTSSSSSPIITRNKYDFVLAQLLGVPRLLGQPLEVLEVAAMVNYNTARPRPIDPAILFDLVKIRKSVEEATDLAVRALSDTVSSAMSSVNSVSGLRAMTSLRGAPQKKTGHGLKMSHERRLRMRELAVQKLARAYRVDDIAACIVTMQGTTSLDDIAGLVLQSHPDNPDARFVHFFHEKILSRNLAGPECFRALEEIMALESKQPELLRTLASLKGATGDMAGAACDLSHAMAFSKYHGESHRSANQDAGSTEQQQQQQQSPQVGRHNVQLPEDKRPSGFEGQLVFHRGSVYLADACDRLLKALGEPTDSNKTVQKTDASLSGDKDAVEADARQPPLADEAITKADAGKRHEKEAELAQTPQSDQAAALTDISKPDKREPELLQQSQSDQVAQTDNTSKSDKKEAELHEPPQSDQAAQTGNNNTNQPDDKEAKLPPKAKKLGSAAADECRQAKALAKHALHDIMFFLNQFDYSPNMPAMLSKDYNERMRLASQGNRNPRSTVSHAAAAAMPPHKLYTLADLLSASPPADLPEYPSQEALKQGKHDVAVVAPQGGGGDAVDTCESVTYHPLLSEALHSVLLCHCIAQTPLAEIKRHAYMVARLIRLCDGWPAFHSTRSSARTDWEDLLRQKGGDWLDLGAEWKFLCEPAPVPGYTPRLPRSSSSSVPSSSSSAPDRRTASAAAATLVAGANDGNNNNAAAAAATHDHHCGANPQTKCRSPFCPNSQSAGPSATHQSAMNLAVELFQDGDHGGWDGAAVVSDRAVAVRRWINEVPFIRAVRRKKRVVVGKDHHGHSHSHHHHGGRHADTAGSSTTGTGAT
ncbi:tetratricopeptide repeat domain-containing protein [Purpureocillium lilacinum]|uniref:Tetratricopeptide repeat domain-containing protein n=1 Tax=Purpureocillium lilacinum TaxID=33203 RepID=A0A179HLD3_PURLI|nr:tetratricopeptide repeat domain-containing protein [Purpureocillium lilacinum]OAQ90804.1 tetratricopeptide repeat domain-containing protein [Purpureocillium lilacinum]